MEHDNKSESENTELVIGLVGAIGTNLKRVKSVITDKLSKAGYDVDEIKMSTDVIGKLGQIDPWDGKKHKRYDSLIRAGNAARKAASEEDERNGIAVLAYGAAALIFGHRVKIDGKGQPAFKKAYIIDSLKRSEEVEALRAIYPQGFVLVGAHEDESQRIDNLCGMNQEQMTLQQAKDLIERDANEEKEEFGQRITKTYHLSDFFVHVSKDAQPLECDINRLVEIWFGDLHATPTFDEYAMYLAFSASLRSSDLSRQVGAVIAREIDGSNEVLSTGANECPKAGGGLYWPIFDDQGCVNTNERGRDFERGEDSNKIQQLEMIDEIISLAKKHGKDIDEAEFKRSLLKSAVADLTEFGRVVHAEMESILACCRNQISTRGTTLFCTTFPCHNCAKHVVAAGVKRVVFIEPYAKSKALEFHDDSIVFGEPRQDDGKESRVRFVPFVGVGPRRFMDLFSMKHGASYDLVRKERSTGKARQRDIAERQLRLQMKSSSYIDLELEASQVFDKFLSHSE